MDGRFTRIATNLLLGVRDLGEWGIESGNTTAQALQLSVAARPEVAAFLHKGGKNQSEIAKMLGVSQRTISGDLAKIAKSGADSAGKSGKSAAESSKTGSTETKAHRAATAARAAAEGVTPAPVDKYRVIYADPPWDYGAHAQPDYQTEQRDHYATMALEAICAEPVKDWVDDSAVLFLWVTSPILEKAFQVIHAWGFEYKTSFVWDKIKHNMGHYNSVRHELLLLCTRGSCQPDIRGDGLKLVDSVLSIERGAHSAKPVEFYDIIESLYTHGKRLEMYARKERDGWDQYGHVAELEAAE